MYQVFATRDNSELFSWPFGKFASILACPDAVNEVVGVGGEWVIKCRLHLRLLGLGYKTKLIEKGIVHLIPLLLFVTPVEV